MNAEGSCCSVCVFLKMNNNDVFPPVESGHVYRDFLFSKRERDLFRNEPFELLS